MSERLDTLVDDVMRFLQFQSSISGGRLYLGNAGEQENRHALPPQELSVEEVIVQKGKVSPVTHSLLDIGEEWMSASTLESLDAQICTCMKCPLGKTRTKFVFGVGNPKAEIMLIGEAPGADEDRQGEPFVGRAGQLLNKILEAVGLKREEVYICNILKCRPPNNRDPQAQEVEQCEPYLQKQIELIHPKIILALGRIAGQTLLRTNDPLTVLRGRVHDYLGIPMMIVYHPAALLRNPNWKRTMWEDMKQFKAYYDTNLAAKR
jgi:uracil-DNA glycosylase